MRSCAVTPQQGLGATLFGAKAKDPWDTQVQLRHEDPTVTLRNYQKSIPANVRAAALALDKELIGTPANRFEQVLNRSGFDDRLEAIESLEPPARIELATC